MKKVRLNCWLSQLQELQYSERSWRRVTAYNMRLAVRSGRQLNSSYDRIGVPALTHGGLTIKPLLLKFIKSRSPATSATRGTLYAIGERGYASGITVKRTDGVALSGDLMRCIRNDSDHRFTVDPICRSLQVVQAHRITKLSARLNAIQSVV